MGSVSLAMLGAPNAAADPAPTPAAFVRDAQTTPAQAGAFNGAVPDGVCAVTVRARGGAGGSSIANSTANTTPTNGGAADITATFQVVAGQSYSGNVATGGAFAAVINQNPAGGVPGGGAGGATTATTTAHNGAGGGGYTDLLIGGLDVLVAGGGGGSGGGHSTVEGRGGDAGLPTGTGVTPGEDGTVGRDNPSTDVSNGGAGGGTAAAGAGGTNTGDAGRNGLAGSGRTGGRGGNDATPDAGGGGGGGYYGGGGGAGTVGNGSGAPSATGIGGAGGGGGSSYLRPTSPDGSGEAPSGITSQLGPTFGTGGNLPGANGYLSLTWQTCTYDLAVNKTVSPNPAEVGQTVTWTITTTNNGPDPMMLGDTVTLADNRPGSGAKTIQSITATGGNNTRGLARGAVTCDAAAGQALPATLTCSRPFSAPNAPTAPTTGVRGLDSGETLTVVYTQVVTAADVGTLSNTATVTDRGNTANNSVTTPLTVALPQPTARPDTSTGTQGAPQSVNPLTNDSPGSASAGSQFDPTTLTLLDGTTPVTTLTIPNQGTYTIDRTDAANPRLVFTPLPTFFGTATPANYRITDNNGQSATSTYTPTVNQVARPDTATGPQGVPLAANVLANDNATPGVTLVPSTLTLIDANGQPATTVTVAGGTYSVVNGQVVFTPNPTFTGTAPPVTYQVNDSNGNPIQSTYTPTITPVAPTAANDSSSGPQGAPQSVDPFANDAPGNAGVPLDRSSLTLLNGAGNPVETLTVAGQGTYTVDRTDPADPRLVFQPLPGYTGTPTPATYRIADANGTTDTASYQPRVLPVTRPDTSTGVQGRPQTVNVLANDTLNPPAGGGFDLNSLQLVDPADGVAKDSVTVAGVGTYTVDNAGNVTFQPLPTYIGTPAALTYQVQDLDGNLLSSTYTPTVTPITPIARPDSSTGPQGRPQSVNPLTNDRPGDVSVPLVPSSLTLLDGTTPVDTLVVSGQGTYTIDRTDPANPRIVFTPLATFTGPATPATYRIADANGTTATSTYTPNLAAVTPTGKPDFTTSSQGDLQVVNPFADNGAGADQPGDPLVPIVQSTLRFVDAAGDPIPDILVVPGQGTYTINRVDPNNPRIEFQPLPDYVGTPTPVSYRFEDQNGTLSDAVTYNPNVLPVTQPDTTTGLQGRPQTINLLANDDLNPPAGGGFNSPTLQLIDPADNTAKDSVTVGGVGTYTVDNAGNVTFQPLPQYVGTPPALTYQVRDADNNLLTDTYTPTVRRVTPTATPDATSGPQGVAQSVNPLTNDDPGDPSVPFDPDSLTLLDGTTPVTTLEITGQGTYSIDRTDAANPRLVFTPLPTFVGTATAASYRIADVNGTTASSTYTPTLVAVAPVARPDVTSGPQGALQRVNPFVDNGSGADTPGNAAVPINRSSLTLLNAGGNPVDTLDVAGEGTYVVDRTDPANPTITFQPLPTFTGPATAVDYRIADANGTFAQSTYTPTVTPVTRPDTSSDVQGVPQTVNVLANDTQSTPGGGGFDPTTLQLIDPADNTAKDSVTIAGVGTYTVDNAGNVTFTPLPTFVGTPDPLTYQVRDLSGGTLQDTYTPTVTAIAPTANPDTTSGPQGVPQQVNPLLGNAAGGADVPGDPRVPLDPDSLTLLDANGDPADTVTVAEGVYTLVRTGTGGPFIVFTPDPTFVGTATPVNYRVADTNGTTAQSTYTPTFVAVSPVANPDVTSGPQGALQRVNPFVDNGSGADTPGSPAVPINRSSLTLLNAAGDPVDSLDVAGEGTYTVDRTDPANPTITFQPLPTFTGPATPVDYRISDANGTFAQSTYTPTVTPVTRPDTSSDVQGVPQTVNVLANDTLSTPGGGGFDPTTLQLIDPADGAAKDSVTIAGVGTYTVDNAGNVTFTPLPNFVGTPDPLSYQVRDLSGGTLQDTYTPTVTAIAPTANPDTTSGPQGVPQRVNPLLGNAAGGADVPGDPRVPLDPDSLTLLDANGDPATSVTVAGEGTYTIVRTGTGGPFIVFTPLPDFVGTATPVGYRVADANGTTADSTYTPTVAAVAPRANPDRTSGPLNRPQSIDPLANDTAGDPAVPLDPSSLTLLDAAGNPATSVTIPGEGTYTIANGKIVFTPVTGFFGPATPVTYRVADANGTTASSTYTPTIIPPDVKIINVSNSGQVGDPVTVNPLDKDPNIAPDSILLIGPNGQLVTTLVVPGEGSWVVDPRTGAITFTPEDGFIGDPTPVDYLAFETDGTPVAGTLTITYEEEGPSDTGPDLADTGAQAGLLGAGLLSLALIGGGIALVVYRRRRPGPTR